MRDTNICAVCGTNPVIRYTANAIGASCAQCQKLKENRIVLYTKLVCEYKEANELGMRQQLPDGVRANIRQQVDEKYPLPKHINP